MKEQSKAQSAIGHKDDNGTDRIAVFGGLFGASALLGAGSGAYRPLISKGGIDTIEELPGNMRAKMMPHIEKLYKSMVAGKIGADEFKQRVRNLVVNELGGAFEKHYSGKRSTVQAVPAESALQSRYDPVRHVVVAPPDNPAIIAHEFAHATGPFRNKKLLMPMALARLVGNVAAPVAGFFAGSEDNEQAGKNVAIGGTLALTPLVLEETRVNYKAMRALKAGGFKGVKPYLPLVGSQISYLAELAGPAGVYLATKYIREKRQDKKAKKEKHD